MLNVQLHKQLPDFTLHVAFQLNQEILVLFGPSGAGKSLTLSCIAGLTRPDTGLIQLHNRTLYRSPTHNIPLHKRRIGFVFQGYALFPHLTVAQNLAYGLRYIKKSRQTVTHMLARLRLQNLAQRYPHQLSGGQQQRVALGRALIIEPHLLLLDEPFAALDRGVKEHLQADIVALQQEHRLTIIYVTHNLEDAFVLGDKLAVMQAGKLHQIGPIKDVFQRPNSRSVAEITGVKNIWQGEVTHSTLAGLQVAWGNCTLDLPPGNYQIGQPLLFYIRPEDVKLIRPHKPLSHIVRYNRLTGTVTDIIDRGLHIALTVTVPTCPTPIHVRFSARSYQDLGIHLGHQITISLLRDAIITINN